jgi:hypothetical protein
LALAEPASLERFGRTNKAVKKHELRRKSDPARPRSIGDASGVTARGDAARLASTDVNQSWL